MASNDDDTSGRSPAPVNSQGLQRSSTMSTPTSPTDTRQSLAGYESIAREMEATPSSFQSTDTVRRRPDAKTSGYGMSHCFTYLRLSTVQIQGQNWQDLANDLDLGNYQLQLASVLTQM